MKERPIIFGAAMVLAVLAGTKTQTRRVAKPIKHPDLGNIYTPGALVMEREPKHVIDRACPYGQIGDKLWLREAHAFTDLADGTPVVAYAADNRQIAIGRDAPDSPDHLIHGYQFANDVHVDRWRPSIHMPRWASRITLDVTGVRVERLQDISEADARAEGIADGGCIECGECEPCGCANPSPDARGSYCALWESINGPYSWQANPWVWVVEFKRVEGATQ